MILDIRHPHKAKLEVEDFFDSHDDLALSADSGETKAVIWLSKEQTKELRDHLDGLLKK